MIDLSWLVSRTGLGIAVAVAAGIVGVLGTVAVRWLLEQVDRPWNRLLRAAEHDRSVKAISGAEPGPAVDEAWRLHARTRKYAQRPARRFQVAAAVADGVLGTSLADAEQPEDALAHLLPAISTLRGVPGMERQLAQFLRTAAWEHQVLEDHESALALVDESLGLLRVIGVSRWQMPGYYRGLRMRISCLTEMRRFDDAIRMSAEAVAAARNGNGDDSLIGTILVEYARTLVTAGRAEEAIEMASIGLERVRGLNAPAHVHSAAQALGIALALAGRDAEAVEPLREAMALSEGWDDQAALDRINYAQSLNRAGRSAEAGEVLALAAPAVGEDAKGVLPRYKGAMYALVQAEVLERQGRPEQASAAARLAEQRFTEVDEMRPGGWFQDQFADIRALRERLEARDPS